MDKVSEALRAARSGDPEALSALVRSQAGRLYGIALRITGDGGLAEDAVQETFVRLLEGRAPPLEEAAAEAWLARVAANQALEALRRRAARSRREERYAMTKNEKRIPPEDPLLSEESAAKVTEALAALEPETRAAVWLHAVEGVSVRDTAEALGAKRSTVARRIAGGLETLRRRLARGGLELPAAAPITSLLKALPRPDAPPALIARLDQLAASLAQSLAQGAGAAASAGAPTPAASAASAGAGTIHLEHIGGIIMSGKKVALSLGLSALILLGGVVLVTRLRQSREDGGQRAVPVAGTELRKASGGAGTSADPGAGRSAAADSTPRVAEVLRGSPVSVRGRITNEEGEGVAKARVVALDLASWKGVSLEARKDGRDGSPPSTPEEARRARELYRERASSLPETSSEADGGYSFRGLQPGEYRILVHHPLFLPSAETIAGVSGREPATADVRLIEASTIEGRVADLEGRPVAGASVRAEPSALRTTGTRRISGELLAWEEGLSIIASGETVSGEDGGFLIPSLEVLHHDITVRREGFLEGQAWRVPASSRGVVITLDPGSALTGRIVDSEGQPVASAEIGLRPARSTEIHRLFDWSQSFEESDAEPKSGRPDDAGRFRIGGLLRGPHDIHVAAPGRTPLLREVAIDQDLVDIGDLRLEEPRHIAGTAYAPDGLPAAGARIFVPRPRKIVEGANRVGAHALEALAESIADAQGRFALTGVPEGPFEVRASREDLDTGVKDGILAGDERVAITLKPALSIHGKVIDAERSLPVEGVEVVAGSRDERKTKTDSSGEFEIRGLSFRELYHGHGRIWLRARHPDFSPYMADVAAVGSSRASPLKIRLSRAGRIGGRVLDAAGAPVAGARVWIEATGLTREALGYSPIQGVTAVSAPDGSYILAPPDELGRMMGDIRVEVLARRQGFSPARVGPLQLPRSGDDWPPCDLVLGEGGVIEGRILGESGAGVARARISAKRASRPGDGRVSAQGGSGAETVGFSRKDGTYEFRGIERGIVEVEVLALGHARKTLPGVEVGEVPVRLDIAIEKGGSIDGRVIDDRGEPVPSAEVAAFPEEESGREDSESPSEFAERMEKLTVPGRESARALADGRFSIRNLPGGTFRVIARAPGYEPAETSGARPGDVLPDMELFRYSAIRGRVLASGTREPVRSFLIDVINKEKREALSRNTNLFDPRFGTEGSLRFEHPAGVYSYDGLRPGPYEVTILAAGFIPLSKDIVLEAGREETLDFLVEPGGRIEGVVRDAETDRPIAGAILYCQRAGDNPMKSARAFFGADPAPSGPDGSFVFEGLRDGKYHVSAGHPFYRQGNSPEAAIEDGKSPPPVEVEMAPAGRLEVEVKGLPRGHGKRRSLRHSVSIEREDPAGEGPKDPRTSFIFVREDGDGRFYAESLEPGIYRVSLKAQEHEEGPMVSLGPMGGFSASMSRGEEKVKALGMVEVRAGETKVIEAKAP